MAINTILILTLGYQWDTILPECSHVHQCLCLCVSFHMSFSLLSPSFCVSPQTHTGIHACLPSMAMTCVSFSSATGDCSHCLIITAHEKCRKFRSLNLLPEMSPPTGWEVDDLRESSSHFEKEGSISVLVGLRSRSEYNSMQQLPQIFFNSSLAYNNVDILL